MELVPAQDIEMDWLVLKSPSRLSFPVLVVVFINHIVFLSEVMSVMKHKEGDIIKKWVVSKEGEEVGSK